MNYGFVKIASAIPSVRVADCQFNIEQIESMVVQAEGRGVEIICFPELSITSYTCQDLFQRLLTGVTGVGNLLIDLDELSQH